MCALSADRTRERCDVDAEAREGWVDEIRLDWKVRWEVVERTNGKGISVCDSQQAVVRLSVEGWIELLLCSWWCNAI